MSVKTAKSAKPAKTPAPAKAVKQAPSAPKETKKEKQLEKRARFTKNQNLNKKDTTKINKTSINKELYQKYKHINKSIKLKFTHYQNIQCKKKLILVKH